MQIARIIATLVLLLSLIGPCAAGALDDARGAYSEGDYTTALRLFRLLAEQGDPVAQSQLGGMYYFGRGVPQNDAEAVKWFQKAADQGYAPAQYNLAYMYEHGQGTPRDYAEAAKLYRQAAQQGYVSAEVRLGTLYDRGRGVTQDAVEAVNWYRKAADAGDALGQLGLGLAYGKGEGVPQNDAEAVKWFQKAADQGVAEAQFVLGIMYHKGRGVLQDDMKAVEWFRKAADQGNADAQEMLADAYALGEGTTKDIVLAYKWENLAAAQGEKQAAKFRDEDANFMTPAQLAEAQKLAREWRPQGRNVARGDDEIPPKPSTSIPNRSSPIEVPLELDDGVFVVPVELNGAIRLNFTVDSGASDITVPLDVFTTLMRTGTIKDSDLLGSQTYVLADGSKSKLARFTIRSLKVGDVILKDVPASVSTTEGMLLLGQSFLQRFKSWSIDNNRHELDLAVQ